MNNTPVSGKSQGFPRKCPRERQEIGFFPAEPVDIRQKRVTFSAEYNRLTTKGNHESPAHHYRNHRRNRHHIGHRGHFHPQRADRTGRGSQSGLEPDRHPASAARRPDSEPRQHRKGIRRARREDLHGNRRRPQPAAGGQRAGRESRSRSHGRIGARPAAGHRRELSDPEGERELHPPAGRAGRNRKPHQRGPHALQ